MPVPMPAVPSGRALRPPPTVIVLASLAPARAAVGRAVRELGYSVIESDDPFEMLRRLRARPGMAQLLLTEVTLPRMDGGEVAERARDLSPALRTVFLSHDADGSDAELLEAYPELPVLELPADQGAVAAVLRGVSGRSRRRPAAPGWRPRGRGRSGTAGEIAGPG